MDATKHHRLLTDPEMFLILKSTEQELSAADAKLGELAGKIYDGIYEPGTYQRLVKSGTFQGSTIRIKGDPDPRVVLIHTQNALGWLTIEGVASLKGCPLSTIFDCVEVMARRCSAPVTLFVSKLSGLIRFAQHRDYQSGGMVFFKKNALAT